MDEFLDSLSPDSRQELIDTFHGLERVRQFARLESVGTRYAQLRQSRPEASVYLLFEAARLAVEIELDLHEPLSAQSFESITTSHPLSAEAREVLNLVCANTDPDAALDPFERDILVEARLMADNPSDGASQTVTMARSIYATAITSQHNHPDAGRFVQAFLDRLDLRQQTDLRTDHPDLYQHLTSLLADRNRLHRDYERILREIQCDNERLQNLAAAYLDPDDLQLERLGLGQDASLGGAEPVTGEDRRRSIRNTIDPLVRWYQSLPPSLTNWQVFPASVPAQVRTLLNELALPRLTALDVDIAAQHLNSDPPASTAAQAQARDYVRLLEPDDDDPRAGLSSLANDSHRFSDTAFANRVQQLARDGDGRRYAVMSQEIRRRFPTELTDADPETAGEGNRLEVALGADVKRWATLSAGRLTAAWQAVFESLAVAATLPESYANVRSWLRTAARDSAALDVVGAQFDTLATYLRDLDALGQAQDRASRHGDLLAMVYDPPLVVTESLISTALRSALEGLPRIQGPDTDGLTLGCVNAIDGVLRKRFANLVGVYDAWLVDLGDEGGLRQLVSMYNSHDIDLRQLTDRFRRLVEVRSGRERPNLDGWIAGVHTEIMDVLRGRLDELVTVLCRDSNAGVPAGTAEGICARTATNVCLAVTQLTETLANPFDGPLWDRFNQVATDLARFDGRPTGRSDRAPVHR